MHHSFIFYFVTHISSTPLFLGYRGALVVFFLICVFGILGQFLKIPFKAHIEGGS
jgi:hypothetical protein